jgi:hypothetical protein
MILLVISILLIVELDLLIDINERKVGERVVVEVIRLEISGAFDDVNVINMLVVGVMLMEKGSDEILLLLLDMNETNYDCKPTPNYSTRRSCLHPPFICLLFNVEEVLMQLYLFFLQKRPLEFV